MSLSGRVAILIPCEIGFDEEFIKSGLKQRLVREGVEVMIPDFTGKDRDWKTIPAEIREMLPDQEEDSVILFGASSAAIHVLNILISGHPAVSAGCIVSPPFIDELLYLLSRIEKPLLIVNGSEDSEEYLKAGRKYHDLIEGSTNRVIRNTGHLPHVDNAERYFITLDKFIDDEL